ncbi:hypothetical protein [Litoribacter ruber]|uniref:hypothetical protein n=1 Tax=Litoribacter ruber TaxID=702568 RepID=UPI00293D711D|nr:hypothetical protein [Litoribacter ruber]
MGKQHSFLFIITFLFPYMLSAQDVQVEGYFRKDSAKLGERVEYVLKATYHPSQQVIFPDSSFRFEDMEYLGRKTFVTDTRDTVTRDSVIYYLSNFSLDPVRNFTMPVYEVLKYDSLEYFPEEDQLALILTLSEIPPEPAFKDNDTYQKIQREFNYPYFYIALSIILVLGIVIYFVFGDKIYNHWLAWLEKRRWNRFEKKWENVTSTFISQPTASHADNVLGLWKRYLELVTNRPYQEWTSTEVAMDLPRDGILDDLRNIELIIYADRKTEQLPAICQNLKTDCRNMYTNKIELIHEHK